MRPMVPYTLVAVKRIAQAMVTTAPMGVIRILRPGSTNGVPEVTTRVCIGDCTTALVTVVAGFAKIP